MRQFNEIRFLLGVGGKEVKKIEWGVTSECMCIYIFCTILTFRNMLMFHIFNTKENINEDGENSKNRIQKQMNLTIFSNE